MFTKIVVGVDGSEQGHDALALAGAVGRMTAADVVIGHAFPRDPLDGRTVLGIAGRPLRDAAEELLATEARHGPEGARTTAVADISPAHALHRLAEAEHADLLVVGSSRRGAIGRVLLGDVARQTIHHAPCAVALAPRGYAAGDHAIRTIGVGFDGSAESLLALDVAAALARTGEGSLHLLAAIAPPFQGPSEYPYPYAVDWSEYYVHATAQATEMLDRAVERLDVPATAEVREDMPVVALRDLSKRCDLLVLGSRHWGTLSRLLLGSTADALTWRTDCPLLVVPRGATGTGEPSEEAAGAAAG